MDLRDLKIRSNGGIGAPLFKHSLEHCFYFGIYRNKPMNQPNIPVETQERRPRH